MDLDRVGFAGLSDVKVVLDMGHQAGLVAASDGACVAAGEGRVLWNLGRVGLDELASFAPSVGSLQVQQAHGHLPCLHVRVLLRGWFDVICGPCIIQREWVDVAAWRWCVGV